MFCWFVVYCKLHLVGLVYFDSMTLSLPTIVARSSGTCCDNILDLDGDKCLGSSRKTAGGSVVYIFDCHDSDEELTAQRLAKVRHVD